MPFLVIDLEATCCDKGTILPEQMEIVEVGAVWAEPTGTIIDTFQRFVRPKERPNLTEFCKSLTHIEQVNIDSASDWSEVVLELSDFASRYPIKIWGSWGAYDRRQIERECIRHFCPNPLAEFLHINLKANFARNRKIKQVGMATALQIVGIEMKGTHHRALSDSINIAQLLPSSMQDN